MVTRYIKDAFLHGAGDSVVGQVRKANEDNCGYRKTVNGELFVVCDGMGGHVGGATASRIAVDSILNFISQQVYEDKRAALDGALRFANTQIMGAAAQDPSLKGMGTTACIALVDAQNIWIAHVGDSRIYLYSEKEHYLYRITKDHSLVQGLVDRGELDDREAEHHPQKNIILRALGTKADVEPEVDQAPVRAQVGDTILICSDGLSGMLDDNQIEAILREDRSLEDKVQKLIDKANTPDKGKDNITVQLIQVQSSLENISVHPNFNPKWRMVKSDAVNAAAAPSVPRAAKAPAPAPRKSNKKTAVILYSALGVFLCAVSAVTMLLALGKFSGDSKDQIAQGPVAVTPSTGDEIMPSKPVENNDEELAEAVSSARSKANEAKEAADKAKKDAVKAENDAKNAKNYDAAKKAKEAAEKAKNAADKAKTDAVDVKSKVADIKLSLTTANEDVEAAIEAAGSAITEAGEAIAIADKAIDKANEKAKQFDAARAKAEEKAKAEAEKNVNAAYTTAETLKSKANSAKTDADNALKAVDTIKTEEGRANVIAQANAAMKKAKEVNDAVTTAEKAANEAKADAEKVKVDAAKAEQALTLLKEAKRIAGEAITTAEKAINGANEKKIEPSPDPGKVVIPTVIDYPNQLKKEKGKRNFDDEFFEQYGLNCTEAGNYVWTSSDSAIVTPTKTKSCSGFNAGKKTGKVMLSGNKDGKTYYIINVEVVEN